MQHKCKLLDISCPEISFAAKSRDAFSLEKSQDKCKERCNALSSSHFSIAISEAYIDTIEVKVPFFSSIVPVFVMKARIN